jgi:hypothetical protein
MSQPGLFQNLDAATPLSVSFTGTPPFYSNRSMAALEASILSNDTGPIPTQELHFSLNQGPTLSSLSIPEAPLERHLTPSTLDYFSLPHSALGDTIDLPIDVEKYYYVRLVFCPRLAEANQYSSHIGVAPRPPYQLPCHDLR